MSIALDEAKRQAAAARTLQGQYKDLARNAHSQEERDDLEFKAAQMQENFWFFSGVVFALSGWADPDIRLTASTPHSFWRGVRRAVGENAYDACLSRSRAPEGVSA